MCGGLWAWHWRRGVRPDAVTLVLAAVCVACYVCGFQRVATPRDGLADAVLANLSHASAGHLIGNMAVFLYLAAILNGLGAARVYYALIFPVCTLVQWVFMGSLLRAAEVWYAWTYSGVWSLLPASWRSTAAPVPRNAVGFSGIVSGVEGYAVLHVLAHMAFGVWCRRAGEARPARFFGVALASTGVWALFVHITVSKWRAELGQAMATYEGASDGIAHDAHIGGLIGGLALGMVRLVRRAREPTRAS